MSVYKAFFSIVLVQQTSGVEETFVTENDPTEHGGPKHQFGLQTPRKGKDETQETKQSQRY